MLKEIPLQSSYVLSPRVQAVHRFHLQAPEGPAQEVELVGTLIPTPAFRSCFLCVKSQRIRYLVTIILITVLCSPSW